MLFSESMFLRYAQDLESESMHDFEAALFFFGHLFIFNDQATIICLEKDILELMLKPLYMSGHEKLI